MLEIDEHRALDLNPQLPFQARDHAVKAVVAVEQVGLGVVSVGVFDLAVAQHGGHDDAAKLFIQRHDNDGVRARVLDDVLRVAVLPQQKIVRELRVDLRLLHDRRARQQQKEQEQRNEAFEHMCLRSGVYRE